MQEARVLLQRSNGGVEIVKLIEIVFDGVDSDDLINKICNDNKAGRYLNAILNGIDNSRVAA